MIITKKQGTLEYQIAEGIAVPHAFTTRLGGVSVGSQASLNLAVGRGDSEENVENNLRTPLLPPGEQICPPTFPNATKNAPR